MYFKLFYFILFLHLTVALTHLGPGFITIPSLAKTNGRHFKKETVVCSRTSLYKLETQEKAGVL